MAQKTSMKDTVILLIALLCIIGSHFVPTFGGLPREAIAVIGVFVGSLLMWIFISIDWPSLITLMGLGLIPMFGFGKTFAGAFGNSTVAFLLFTFALLYPLGKTNFVRRCTVAFITNPIARRGPWYFVSFLLAAVTFLGLFISPSVLFVAFMPFLEDIYRVLEVKKGGKTGAMLMFGSAICINLSSGMTAIGHVWPTMAMAAASSAGYEINQFQFMAIGIPTGIILITIFLIACRVLYRPDDIQDLNPEKAMALRGTVPSADLKENIILATVGLTVILWVGPSLIKGSMPALYKSINSMTTAMPPLLGCIILFIAKIDGERLMNFKESTTKGILWGSILMTGAATYLGGCMANDAVGLKPWLSTTLAPIVTTLPLKSMIAFFMTWAIIQTNFSSNIVTTTVVSAVVVSVLTALPAGVVSVGTVVSMVGICAAICSMTPAGQSTVNTVAIGSGWTTAKDMFIWGFVLAFSAVIVLTFITYPLGAIIIG